MWLLQHSSGLVTSLGPCDHITGCRSSPGSSSNYVSSCTLGCRANTCAMSTISAKVVTLLTSLHWLSRPVRGQQRVRAWPLDHDIPNCLEFSILCGRTTAMERFTTWRKTPLLRKPKIPRHIILNSKGIQCNTLACWQVLSQFDWYFVLSDNIVRGRRFWTIGNVRSVI